MRATTSLPLPRLQGKSTFVLPYHNQSTASLALCTFDPQTGAQLRRDLTAMPTRQRVPAGPPLLAMTPTRPTAGVPRYEPGRKLLRIEAQPLK